MRSKDPSTQVGACIVSNDNRILSIGYNGAPNGFSDEEFPWAREGKNLDTKYPYVCHAEMNAILNYRGSKKDLENAKIYVDLFPCNECAKIIIQAGIKEVVYLSDKYADSDNNIASRKLFDCCGVKYRKKSKIKEDIERYSIIRTVSAVERCNVAVLVIDATEGITDQDAKIAGIAHERGKGMIIAVNKWDAIEKNDKTIYKFTEEIRNKLSYMPYAELLFISAETGQRLPKLFETIDAVIENHSLRVATGVLNEIMSEAVAMQQPPSDKGKRLKLFYITQVSVKPPTFVIFVNDKELMHFSYTRYIENRIRESFGFRGTPLKFIIRERKEK